MTGGNSTIWTSLQDAELLRHAPSSGRPAEFEADYVAGKMEHCRPGTSNRACHDRWKRLQQEMKLGQPRSAHYWSDLDVHRLKNLVANIVGNINWVRVAQEMNNCWKDQPGNSCGSPPFRPNSCKQQWNARRNRRRWRESAAVRGVQQSPESSGPRTNHTQDNSSSNPGDSQGASPSADQYPSKIEFSEDESNQPSSEPQNPESPSQERSPSPTVKIEGEKLEYTAVLSSSVTLDAVIARRRHVFEARGLLRE